MTPVALDGTKLLILMIAGGVFALAGLWLMFRSQAATQAGEAARIELFGLKFQSSSAGLLVFLIGAVFLAVPIIVPEKQRVATGGAVLQPTADEQAKPDEAGPGAALGSTGPASPTTADTSAPVRARATGREVEPNELYERANRLALGDSITGSLAPDDEDWFAIPTGSTRQQIEVRIRSNSEYCYNSRIFVYSPDERLLEPNGEWFGAVNTSKTWRIEPGGADWIFLRLSNSVDCDYELFTGAGAN